MATPKKSAAKTTKKAAKKAPAKKASGNPKVRDIKSGRTTTSTPTAAKAWKGKEAKRPHPLDLPSGNTALVKRVGMESFLQGGNVPNVLMPIVQDALENAKQRTNPRQKAMTKKEELDLTKLMAEDPEKIAEMFSMVDVIVTQVVIEPPVRSGHWTEEDRRKDSSILPAFVEGVEDAREGPRVGEFIPFSERNDDLLYVDDVDEEDKMFIFNYVVGGSADAERFRSEAAQRVAALDDK